ncbi:Probable ubiquinone biosynthesis protein UbiB [Leclercia adecarboxylata]|uniref:Probable ubiquinone biosynthesis protein UbiB n=1 Tax=Leclercia adecarboxylata TaxID=83655 RepID=A0A4U9IV41_9ENTR|nr:Probable ubiquinone biosynthesis protein UbiB [Leclercia adecarboxylata]
MTPGEIRRLYFIIRTFLSYGLGRTYPQNAYHNAAAYLATNAILDA